MGGRSTAPALALEVDEGHAHVRLKNKPFRAPWHFW
jgi:hypothetical protein